MKKNDSALFALFILASILVFGTQATNLTIRSAVQWNWAPCGEFCEWTWYRAQLVAESNLQPDALSKAGAQGIAQFMPQTWTDLTERWNIPERYTPYDHKIAIELGARYMRYLIDQWSAPRPAYDRMALARASYNAGLGSILKSQELCNGCIDYLSTIDRLPEVTGERATETINYERNILKEHTKWTQHN